MKKILVIALAVVMAVSVLAFAACEKEQTYTGKCQYSTNWGSYGCKVDVTVKGNTITKVKLYTDEEAGEGFTRTTTSWTEGAHDGDLGFTKAEAAYSEWLTKTFVGKTVDQVNAYVASATAEGQTVGTASANLKGATQSAARIIVAVQDALSQLGK